jgi:hypothetical protein
MGSRGVLIHGGGRTDMAQESGQIHFASIEKMSRRVTNPD